MSTPWFTASSGLVISFCVVVLAALGGLVFGVAWGDRRTGSPTGVWRPFALGVAAYVAVAIGVASTGVLRGDGMPPRPLLMFWFGFALLYAATRHPRLARAVAAAPLWYWVGLQVFRLPLELVMHQAAVEGVMPWVMSFSGRNFDIVTGLLAPVAAWSLARGGPRWVATAFNVVGAALLINVVGVAILTMPTPIRQFFEDPPNVWVSYPPFVLLPGALVVLAAWSHVVIARSGRPPSP